MWNHDWGPPHVATVRTEEGVLYTARQTCEACGTSRNPFNHIITYFPRARSCRQLSQRAEPRDWSRELEHVRWILEAHQSDGDRVDRQHTGRKQRADTAPELPLPYKR